MTVKRTFGLVALVVGGMIAAEAEGHACSPVLPDPSPALTSAELVMTRHLAKNVGIPIEVRSIGPLSAELVRANLVVTVRSGTTELAGSVEPLVSSGAWFYRWRPAAGATPVGELTVTLAVADQTPATSTITVEDRIAAIPPTGATIAVSRSIVEDEQAPTITCSRTRGIGECSSGKYDEKIATHWIGVPNVEATLSPAPTVDQPLVQIATAIFGRDRNGTKSPGPSFTYSQSSTTYGRLDRAYDEYCVTTTTTLLGLPDASVTTTCASPRVDLSVSNDEAVAKIRRRTTSCDSTVYPAGTSEDDPTGEGGGCSIGRRPAHAPTMEIALVLGAALVLGRAKRRRVTSS